MPRLLLCAVSLVLSLCVATPGACAQPAPPEIGEVLSLDRVGVGRRSTVNTDAVEHLVATGAFEAPDAGTVVVDPDGEEQAWAVVERNENGGHRQPGGGWLFTTVTAEGDGDWILVARGHRHVYVNGEARVGDLYNLGITRVPVRLRAGENTLLFKAGRGPLTFAFEEPPAEVFAETRDPTLPDYLRGDRSVVLAGVLVTNSTGGWVSGVRGVVSVEGGAEVVSELPMLPAHTSRKVALRLPPCPEVAEGEDSVRVTIRLEAEGVEVGEAVGFDVSVREPNQKHSRTFISNIDGSVQYYGVTPPPDATLDIPQDPHRLLLTLHGASVEGRGQSNAYAQRDGWYIVAPTNRRPFGFDWEDWGRLDAMEVLEHASARFNADPSRTYLSGHSMGGHGTWSIGAYHAGRFAGIAPSAGWRDFWSYGGGGEFDTGTAIGALLDRSANASRTLLMERNYFDLGVYILHGDADDNVPVSQARFMRERLAPSHTNFGYYERPGAGHWWGNLCVDWPPIFAMFEQTALDPSPRRVDFTTVDPGIASRRAWVTIERQVRAREASRVVAEYDAESHAVTVTPENVEGFSLDLSVFVSDEHPEPPAVLLSEVELSGETGSFARAADGRWGVAEFDGSGRHPGRNGPFKDAFRNRVLFVVGTRGTDEENAWALSKARYDAETFWYRGNGSIEIVRDTDFDPEAEPDRGVILYGNASTNGAWVALLGASPIWLDRSSVMLLPPPPGTGDARQVGREGLALLMAVPRPGSDLAMVGVVGGTDLTGMRLTAQFPYFVSGVHYPDWFLAKPSIYLEGEAGVVGAGFFSNGWRLGEDYVLTGE
ncbi:MAG: prolyl oligopeptidase family serine peptidase [Phycisphaerales bacterium JB040]